MLSVYLAGEIHTNWREEIADGAQNLNVMFTAPVTDHEASDDCGVKIMGSEELKFWHDHKGAKLNAIRTRRFIEEADVIVVRFGEKYKQWNAAFDAGICAALDKPYITLHNQEIIHPWKEVDGAAMAWAETTEQVVEILDYITTKE